MKILFLAPSYYPQIGGVEQHIRELSRLLVADGHTVTVLVEKQKPSEPDCEFEEGIRVIRWPKQTRRFLKVIGRRFALFRRIWELLSADLIHAHDHSVLMALGLSTVLLLRLLGKRVWITFHGWEGFCPPRDGDVLRRKLAEFVTNGNICIGHFIEKWYGTRAGRISYGGVNVNREPVTKKPTILFLGRLAEDSGIRQYLEAWRMLEAGYPELTFRICGDGPLREELERYCVEHGLHHVAFAGAVTDPEKQLAIAQVAFVTGYLSMLEAFAARTAVLAVYTNELKRDYLSMIPGAESILLTADSSAEIVRLFPRALAAGSQLDRASSFADKHSWEAVKNDYYELWQVK